MWKITHFFLSFNFAAMRLIVMKKLITVYCMTGRDINTLSGKTMEGGGLKSIKIQIHGQHSLCELNNFQVIEIS